MLSADGTVKNVIAALFFDGYYVVKATLIFVWSETTRWQKCSTI